jgi:hypothetical protein
MSRASAAAYTLSTVTKFHPLSLAVREAFLISPSSLEVLAVGPSDCIGNCGRLRMTDHRSLVKVTQTVPGATCDKSNPHTVVHPVRTTMHTPQVAWAPMPVIAYANGVQYMSGGPDVAPMIRRPASKSPVRASPRNRWLATSGPAVAHNPAANNARSNHGMLISPPRRAARAVAATVSPITQATASNPLAMSWAMAHRPGAMPRIR